MVIIKKRYKTITSSRFGINLAIVVSLLFSVFISETMFSQVIENKDTARIDTVNSKLTAISKTDTTKSELSTKSNSDSLLNSSKGLTKPAKATLYSTILPGLGQIYNGKYWKVPIIYSAFAGIFFMAGDNNFKYNQFKEQYAKSLAGLELDEPFDQNYTKETLLQGKEYYKRNRDFQIILGVLAYLLNILDANVDAHLMDYDITPDLTLNVKPEVNNYFARENYTSKPGFGIKFVLSLH